MIKKAVPLLLLFLVPAISCRGPFDMDAGG